MLQSLRSFRGVTLPELLVVVSIIGLGVMAAVPLVSEQVRKVRVRAAADQFTMSLRAARMIAVARRVPIEVMIVDAGEESGNYYEYTDQGGNVRRFPLPDGADIHPASAASIEFQPNGSLTVGPRTVYIEARLDRGSIERWSIHTNIIGVTTVSHQVFD